MQDMPSIVFGNLAVAIPILIVLVAAFLAMQWSTAHIHLAENHHHDGSHHQHNIAVHSHQSISLYDDSIESSLLHDAHNDNAVDLDCECHRQSGKRFDAHVVVLITLGLQKNLLSRTEWVHKRDSS